MTATFAFVVEGLKREWKRDGRLDLAESGAAQKKDTCGNLTCEREMCIKALN